MGEPYRDRLSLEGEDEGSDAVTVATYSTTVEAEMSREYLKAHGVEAFTHDAASFNPLMNVTAGGARLLVAATDEARARWYLERAARTPATSSEDDDEEGEVRCPKCELTYCFHENVMDSEARQGTFTSPLVALIALPLKLGRKRWRCHKCLHVWDDAEEGPKRATPLNPDDPRPVFRLRRRRAGTGVLLGIVAMFGVWMLGAGAVSSGPAYLPFFVLGFVPVFLGYRIGRRTVTDYCSAPHCRAVLGRGDEECGTCHGFVAGVIDYGHEHYSRSAEFRRELRALEAEEQEEALAKKKKKKTGKKRSTALEKSEG